MTERIMTFRFALSAVLAAAAVFTVSCAQDIHTLEQGDPAAGYTASGNTEGLRKIINRKKPADSVTAQGIPLLVLAAANQQTGSVKVLLEKGASVSLADANGNQAIHVAAGKDNAEIVRLLLSKGADPEAQGRYGRTPLMEAARTGSRKTFALLLEKVKEIDLQDGLGRTTLMHAAQSPSDDPAFIQMLLKKGAHQNIMDKNGKTATMYAAELRHTRCAVTLLENNERFRDDPVLGLLAMRSAIRGGDKELILYLIRKKVPLNWSKRAAENYLQRIDMNGVYYILVRNNVFDNRRAPLLWAAMDDNLEMVKFLLENGANVLQEDENGDRASTLATRREVVQYLRREEASARKEIRKKEMKKRPSMFKSHLLNGINWEN